MTKELELVLIIVALFAYGVIITGYHLSYRKWVEQKKRNSRIAAQWDKLQRARTGYRIGK